MPWKESTSMSSRQEFVLLALRPSANIAELCRRFGVSRKTAYKWLERYRAGGELGLLDRSRQPHSSPVTADGELEMQVLALHLEYPYWGARKLCALLPDAVKRPHHSTVHAILKRHGCQVLGAPVSQNIVFNRFEHELPNDLWQMDFKGHFALTDTAAGRCHPLTVLDDHSRFSLCIAACADQRYVTVRMALQSTFERYGMPARFTADNGPPWGSTGLIGLTKLEVWLTRLGIAVGHSRPNHPQTQGKDERFHRTLKLEVIGRKGYGSLAQCQRAFDDWREIYNTVRPHQALNQQPPISRYRCSGRSFPSVLPPIEYLPDDQVRKVSKLGYISYRNQSFFVGEGLYAELVAIRPTGTDGVLEVYFCKHKVRQIDLQNPS
ncbi:IS481 family transposase [Pseudoduganella flava]|uniref:IS481 family transposase n=2 Tax=Pseudoduganella flava TaxID=871742 RepID=A0ABX6FZ26_9BURK|nr:IS481 family transposase [Pseudoduganella flava]QGZ42748.1 IS481 family transposase [Pseudoduganella flava]